MEKKNTWQLGLIVAVIGLTLYNILPTIFYYTKPLKSPIDATHADTIIESTVNRVNQLEEESITWLESFNKLLGIKGAKITPNPDLPLQITLNFANASDADLFKKTLARAGSLIPFYPSQLSIQSQMGEAALDETTVIVRRNIPIHFEKDKVNQFFTFSEMHEADGTITKKYENLIQDRILQLAVSIGGPSENAGLVSLAIQKDSGARAEEFLFMIAQSILNIDSTFSNQMEIARRFYATFTQGISQDPAAVINQLIDSMTGLKDQVQVKKIELKEKESKLKGEGTALSDHEIAELNTFSQKEDRLMKAIAILRKEKKAFATGQTPLTFNSVFQMQNRSPFQKNATKLALSDYNPLIDSIQYNAAGETLSLHLKSDIAKLRAEWESREEYKGRLDALNQMIFNEIAQISRDSDELLTPSKDEFIVKVKNLPKSTAFISFDLSKVASVLYNHTKNLIAENWTPKSPDLKRDAYPIIGWKEFEKRSPSQKHLQLVLYAPALSSKSSIPGFRANSIYVIAKDMRKILEKAGQSPSSESSSQIQSDFTELVTLLRENGFNGYPGTTYPLPPEFAQDYVFEISDYYLPLLQATREAYTVHGTKRYAILELSDLQERILTLNNIETKEHEDLLRARDEYNAAKVNPDLNARFDVPKPTKNVYLDNFLLSARKYFRGDERKILQWGLDLSGGKTVQLALKDGNNKLVTDESDLKQGINELYNRVNKMGVSDVNIRQEGTNITLDFPGSQDISAAELIKASTMTFNFVNEKFATSGASLSPEVNQFLQEVWNEAVVTNKKDLDNINQIAWKHLYGDSLSGDTAIPRSPSAKALLENGLALQNPLDPAVSHLVDDTQSKVAMYRGDNFSDWQGQSHPLLLIFKNYALEGSNLEGVQAGYDPTKGNFLSFQIKSSSVEKNGVKSSPSKDLYAWTSLFSKETIGGTPYEAYSQGRGWRMAVILNGYVVSSPQLESPLKNSGMITGHFTGREINRLVSDLKAGSLTFTPQILSEQSISPELGYRERVQGITATIIALLAVMFIMIGYYRFSGLIASIAVIFNIIIIWATLQNVGATITLAGIAGIILTVGMAVDANVLVFERIREEFEKTQKIKSAVQAGYKKAYSAIIDSNVTTIIAALILLNFDSGPIKGFAVTLIIGIVSSMFTALFMTRYFFSKWVQNPNHKSLNMMNLIRPQNWDFLKFGKLSMWICLAIIALGGYGLVQNQSTILGMDFTGGYSLTVELEKSDQMNYRAEVEKALMQGGIAPQEMQVRELHPNNQLRIFLSKNLDRQGSPFYGLPIALQKESTMHSFETNPRLVWLIGALEKAHLKLTQDSLAKVNLSWKSVSGQMSDSMRTQAAIGLVLALICILIYITFRFEFTFAISATIGLAFDVLVTIALLAILHLCYVPVQIDLNTIAALMTIIGYSLNDTIIVFDRVREDTKIMRRNSMKEIINHSLNVTLSRTLLTSGTTFVVLIALVLFGGSTIFGFSLIMAIGVIVGTLSTFFIASPLLLFFQRREEGKPNEEIEVLE